MTFPQLLPHLNGALNAVVLLLLLAGFTAIRRGARKLHPRLMLAAVATGVVFLAGYLTQYALAGHQRFPGDDWVRTVFLLVLGTHTVLAVVVVPLVLRTLFLGARERLAEHRRLARWTLAVWVYVASTGLLIYWMNNHLRPQ